MSQHLRGSRDPHGSPLKVPSAVVPLYAVYRRARAVALAATLQHAWSQRVGQAAEPYNATADVCRRDMSVVIRARLTAAVQRRGTHASARRSRCHPVIARGRHRSTPLRQPHGQKVLPARRGDVRRGAVFDDKPTSRQARSRPFSRPSFGQIPRHLTPQVSAYFDRAAKSHPHLARGRSANDRTRKARDVRHPRKHVCQLPTWRDAADYDQRASPL